MHLICNVDKQLCPDLVSKLSSSVMLEWHVMSYEYADNCIYRNYLSGTL